MAGVHRLPGRPDLTLVTRTTTARHGPRSGPGHDIPRSAAGHEARTTATGWLPVPGPAGPADGRSCPNETEAHQIPPQTRLPTWTPTPRPSPLAATRSNQPSPTSA